MRKWLIVLGYLLLAGIVIGKTYASLVDEAVPRRNQNRGLAYFER